MTPTPLTDKLRRTLGEVHNMGDRATYLWLTGAYIEAAYTLIQRKLVRVDMVVGEDDGPVRLTPAGRVALGLPEYPTEAERIAAYEARRGPGFPPMPRDPDPPKLP